jgi:CDGSH-type Zn-finger protein/truncated hemoglobin YjbI
MALCRCGESARKPLCDGTHADVGFRDDKDPERVPDRRDTYDGVQITILDNRGTCQHSGLCSDRLAAVFRVDQEPFVAPSGGRMDEIIRAVRDCPSGALSYALEGTEARDHVDWSQRRDPHIEVTKDGPYRITGGIPLSDSHDDHIHRNAGASCEHYALCRCGHSQNKPFCSGMHWYVEFRDPLPDQAREPTLYEWSGGLPALTRTARLLYEKYIPADEMLASRYAQMDVDHPQSVAHQIAAAFGARDTDGTDAGSPALLDATFTDAERARWVELFVRAADDARLPADPQFRSALLSYLQFQASVPASTSRSGATRWDWAPGGAPPWPPDHIDEASKIEEVTLPAEDELVSFERHVKPLFRAKDQQSMRFAFDLWSRDDVADNADAILARLQQGTMPCDGAWPNERIDVFARWVATDKNP